MDRDIRQKGSGVNVNAVCFSRIIVFKYHLIIAVNEVFYENH